MAEILHHDPTFKTFQNHFVGPLESTGSTAGLLVEDLLQRLVREVDEDLLQAVRREALEPRDVEDADEAH